MSRKIFVFGSNTQGRHGKGTALLAREKYGAVYGQPEGLQGDAYAIVTKELRPGRRKVTLEQVRAGVTEFLKFAKARPELTFVVSPIGCGLAGFTPGEIAPLFRGHGGNVELPPEFREWLEGSL